MTSLQPRKPYTEEELQKLYPPGLDLQLVQVLMRHGERTPVSARFQNAGLSPFWPYCSVARQLRAAMLDVDAGGSGSGAGTTLPSLSTLEWTKRLETFGAGDEPQIATGPRGQLDGLCDMGMLTDEGRVSTHQLGRRLRELYVDRLGFLPPAIRSTDAMYLRSTPVPRSLESLQQTFSALYPPPTRLPGADGSPFRPPTILTRAPPDETLYPNDGNCRRFAELSRAFAQRTADRWNDTDDMAYLNRIWARWMPANSPRVAVDSRPRLTGIMDTVNSTLAHGPETRLPKEFYDQKGREIIEKIGVEEWFSGYKESREYRALGMGSLLGDIVGRMVASAENPPPASANSASPPAPGDLLKTTGQATRSPSSSSSSSSSAQTPIRFCLSGTHDTTLAGILASLGAFDTDKWPPYTSHVAIEMFRQSSPPSAAAAGGAASGSDGSLWSKIVSSAGNPPPGIRRKATDELTPEEKKRLEGFFVRVRYNDEPVTVPGCKPAGNHLEGDESFCTLAAFKAIVDKFTPRDWKEECRANLKAPAFPDTPEPAGH